MPFITLFIGGALRRFLDALKWCAERPAIAIATASIVVAGFFYLRADHFREKFENLSDEYALHKRADDEARKFALAEKKRIEIEQKAKTDEADKDLRIALDDAHARLRAYAKRHAASVSSAPASPEVADGPDPEAIVATINDARICTVNTVRLLNAQAWAFDIYGGNQ
jgi:hypothetical protein